MAFETTPTHGKWGNIYWLRPNGFDGAGLNDLTWGAASSESDSFHIEVEITTGGATSPNVFRWRENGGSWTSSVNVVLLGNSLVGACGTQAITSWGSLTGHTVGDKWTIGNLFAEPTSESTIYAQITDPDKRLINPNAPPIWTDSGGGHVLAVDNILGRATFDKNATIVTVAGDNGYILEANIQQLGYIQGWAFTNTCDLAPADRQGQHHHEFQPGEAGCTGTIDRMFIATQTLFETLKAAADTASAGYCLLQLFVNDPDQDQTGTHISMWATFTNFGLSAPASDVVKSNVGFTAHGIVSTITANV